ncbi:MAG TPA: hypothetical protein VHS99_05310 [Chloroflexota bacterium]|jgi:hypothetical protein|nr:hypothetical protein [Chloroflexota bacterium]
MRWEFKGKDRFVKAVLAWICAGHVLTGLVALVSGQKGVRAGSMLYGASFEAHPQLRYILRPLGAYILSLAFLQGMAVTDPRRYKAVIDATLAVFGMRQLQRIAFAGEVSHTFGIAPTRHWLMNAYFLTLALLLLIGRLKLERDAA